MKVNSPLANFIEVLKQVNDVAKNHAPRLRNNEAATRAALIDPILRALGWDISNPDMVELEKAYGNTRLDYALLDCQSNVGMIVEAKALGNNLNDPKITAQTFAYCFNYKIQNIILTDGIIWQHYLNVSPTNMTPDCFDISKDDLTTCAEFFINKADAYRYWTPSTSVVTVAQTAQKATIPIAQVPPPVVSQPINSTGFTSLDKLPIDLRGKQPPKSLHLPDGSIIPIHYWKDILVECVKFVLNEVPGISVPLLDRAGKKNHLLTDTKPGMGISSTPVKHNGKTVYIYVNYDGHNCVANAQYILTYLPKNKTWQPVEVSF